MEVTSRFYRIIHWTPGALLAIGATALVSACDSGKQDDSGALRGEEYRQEQHKDTRDTEQDRSISDRSSEAQTTARYGMINAASAEIEPTEGHSATGTVTFGPTEDRQHMAVSVELAGLTEGPHGLHIHETGDCSASDASSAGGHFAPYGNAHGAPDADAHHVGDLGNITADADGNVHAEMQFDQLAFSGPASILQKAVVVHAGEDDLTSNPSGNSGDRVGCGVIRQEQEITPDSVGSAPEEERSSGQR